MRHFSKGHKLVAVQHKGYQHVNARKREPTGNSHRLGYLLSRYPGISHTFFLQEIRGLRELGFDIATASVNAPDRAHQQLTTVEAEEAATTFYLKPIPRGRAMLHLLRIVCASPASAVRALRADLRLRPSSFRQRLFSLFYVAEALLLCDWIRRRGITHLHVHFGGAVATVGLIAAAAARIPYSLTIHGPDEFFDELGMHLRQKFENAAFVIAISHYCRSQIMRIASPAHWDRFETVRLGIRPELLPARIPREVPAALQLVMVGRLVPTKGPLLLLQAVAQLRSHGIAAALTIIGDGPERADLESFMQQHDLTSVVTLTGALNHDETLKHVAGADLFVLASFAEGIPVSLMEAMALGVPCISTYIAGIPELIDHDRDGILVPAGSVDELTRAILRLARDPALRQRLAEAARAHVLREYHLPENLKLLADTLNRRISASQRMVGGS
ncbi:MAG TPA: glycosyltransferase family 4 protein [Acidobacteriaceae bacterium]|nr:glycosyltransferase family 4 protein [Acidobacteriaceae bacterium]